MLESGKVNVGSGTSSEIGNKPSVGVGTEGGNTQGGGGAGETTTQQPKPGAGGKLLLK